MDRKLPRRPPRLFPQLPISPQYGFVLPPPKGGRAPNSPSLGACSPARPSGAPLFGSSHGLEWPPRARGHVVSSRQNTPARNPSSITSSPPRSGNRPSWGIPRKSLDAVRQSRPRQRARGPTLFWASLSSGCQGIGAVPPASVPPLQLAQANQHHLTLVRAFGRSRGGGAYGTTLPPAP